MQIDQNAMLIIGGIVAVILLVIIIANARGGRTVPPAAPRRQGHNEFTTTGDVSVEIRLSRLADLRNKGLVTEEEYESQRSRIIGEI
jgi:hypothetical protein